jgi:uncharacterized protein
MNRFAAATVALLCLSPAALAAAPAPAASLPVELSRLVLPRESWDRMMVQSADQVLDMIVSSSQGKVQLTPALRDRVRRDFAAVVSYAEMIDLQAGLLAKHYTDAEVRELLAFYRTPLGQKAIRIMPDVSADVNGQLQVTLQQKLPALIQGLTEFMQAEASHGAKK